MAKQTILFLTIKLSYFFKHIWVKLRRVTTLVVSSNLVPAMAGQNHFLPVQLTLFTVISIETRNMSGVYIQIFKTHILDLVTIYVRDIMLSVNLVTHMSISDVLVKTC